VVLDTSLSIYGRFHSRAESPTKKVSSIIFWTRYLLTKNNMTRRFWSKIYSEINVHFPQR
jgi:hypothetical protein